MIDLYNLDCLQVLLDGPSNSIDLVVTSPPYDNLRDYNNSLSWDFENIAKELTRVLKPGGVIVWVVGDGVIEGSESGSSFKQALFFKSLGLNLHDTMIYQKTSTALTDKSRYQQAFEYMFIISKGAPKTFNLIEDRKNKWAGTKVHGSNRNVDGTTTKKVSNKLIKEYGRRLNIWEIPNPGIPGQIHPATFPLSLAEDHIKSWSVEGDVVLDPFMGSGTTGEAALSLKREFIGIEKVKEYFDISSNRLFKYKEK